MPKSKLTFREEWYFTKQDIVSYLISSILYLALSISVVCSLQTLIYAVFECMFFYISFWYIRSNFIHTYHSDDWSTCKFWTRIMLCLGVILLWLLPLDYSLINSLLIASLCCITLYVIEIKVHKDIYAMSKEELYEHCRSRGLDDVECKIAYYVIIERLKGAELYEAIGYSERQTIRKRQEILSKIE